MSESALGPQKGVYLLGGLPVVLFGMRVVWRRKAIVERRRFGFTRVQAGVEVVRDHANSF
jgi:hypothetical protein